MRAMWHERLGSYSTPMHLPSMPSRSRRLKSISRYIFLAPPPMPRLVTLPLWLRPPLLGRGASSDFSGKFFVTSACMFTEANRLPAEVFLYTRIGMVASSDFPSALEQFDRIVRVQPHGRLLRERLGHLPIL